MVNMQLFHNALFSANRQPTRYMKHMGRLTRAKLTHLASLKAVPGWVGWDE